MVPDGVDDGGDIIPRTRLDRVVRFAPMQLAGERADVADGQRRIEIGDEVIDLGAGVSIVERRIDGAHLQRRQIEHDAADALLHLRCDAIARFDALGAQQRRSPADALREHGVRNLAAVRQDETRLRAIGWKPRLNQRVEVGGVRSSHRDWRRRAPDPSLIAPTQRRVAPPSLDSLDRYHRCTPLHSPLP